MTGVGTGSVCASLRSGLMSQTRRSIASFLGDRASTP
jgi:hypothetical protein